MTQMANWSAPPIDEGVPYKVVNATSLVINVTFTSARGGSKTLPVPSSYEITNGELHLDNWNGNSRLRTWRVQKL